MHGDSVLRTNTINYSIVNIFTGVPEKTACVGRDDSAVGIVESVSAVVAAVRDDRRRDAVSQLGFS